MTLSDEAGRLGAEIAKTASVWGATLWGLVTQHNVALALSAVYTALQLYVLVRDKFVHQPRHARWFRRSRP